MSQGAVSNGWRPICVSSTHQVSDGKSRAHWARSTIQSFVILRLTGNVADLDRKPSPRIKRVKSGQISIGSWFAMSTMTNIADGKRIQ